MVWALSFFTPKLKKKSFSKEKLFPRLESVFIRSSLGVGN